MVSMAGGNSLRHVTTDAALMLEALVTVPCQVAQIREGLKEALKHRPVLEGFFPCA